MNERTLPWWLRMLLIASALAQIGFGLTLLINPSAIASVWPWQMTPVTARLLGASSLVSVPMAFAAVFLNRWRAARIALVMMMMYRIFQLVAGVIHIDRFDLRSLVAINYFGGGTVMLVALALALWRGGVLGRPADAGHSVLRGESRLVIGRTMRILMLALAVVYLVFGLTFLFLAQGASFLWFEKQGDLTPLTAQLFSSPTLGLALGMLLITRARYWREVGIPALGMVTFGLTGTLSMILGIGSVLPPTPLGYAFPVTPVVLLLIGLYLLLPGRSAAPAEPSNVSPRP